MSAPLWGSLLVLNRFLSLFQRSPVQIWLYENTDIRLTGVIIGFDEFMNVVLDNAEEVKQDEFKTRTPLGRIMLKGDNISVLQSLAAAK